MKCITPEAWWKNVHHSMKYRSKLAFVSTFILGLLIHLSIMVKDIPNHDGLASIYFNQDMITSGRWFLTVACGISSYYTLPWLIGVLSLLYLSITAVLLVEILDIRSKAGIVLAGGLLVAFPSFASTFAYAFTADGYMLALLLAVLAVYVTKEYKRGFWLGGVCLCLSLATYQAYLPVAMLLSLYLIMNILLLKQKAREKCQGILRYFAMGIIGAVSYFVILQILLKVRGLHLGTYQGIAEAGSIAGDTGFLESLFRMYYDFAAFTLKGQVVFHNFPSTVAFIVLLVVALWSVTAIAGKEKLYKNPLFYITLAAFLSVIPLCANVVMLISNDVAYHLLMRYQWAIFLLLIISMAEKHLADKPVAQWMMVCAGIVLIFCYGVMSNIGYSNLEKKYEKTYAYCVRLVDRMEQTEGYYQGIPVAMIGAVSEKEYPDTDVTLDVTAPMIGLYGTDLVYTGINYQSFLANYLNVTIQLVSEEELLRLYKTEAYQSLDSFPASNSMVVYDGVLLIKTEE